MIFFKKKKIVLDCFTTDYEVFETEKIQESQYFVPEWWKNLPSSYNTEGFLKNKTMKGCAGFIELYKAGFIMPIWTDFDILISNNVKKEISWQFADRKTNLDIHPSAQRAGWISSPNFYNIKIVSPWKLVSPNDIKWHVSFPLYNHSSINDITGTSGLVEFKYNHELNINLLIELKEFDRITRIKKGTPMIQCVPLSEKEIKIKCHLVSETEIKKLAPNRFNNYFNFGYYKYLKKN